MGKLKVPDCSVRVHMRTTVTDAERERLRRRLADLMRRLLEPEEAKIAP